SYISPQFFMYLYCTTKAAKNKAGRAALPCSLLENLQTHFGLNFLKALNGEVEVFFGVAGRNLGADAVAALGHDRIAESDDVHALVEHPGGEFVGNFGVIEHNGHDGVLAGQQ